MACVSVETGAVFTLLISDNATLNNDTKRNILFAGR